MTKILPLLALLGLLAISQVSFAQTTHYTGIANIRDTGSVERDYTGCCYAQNWDNLAIDSAVYVVFYSGSKIDSVGYTIFITKSRSAINAIYFSGDPSSINYLKNDADSIVFQIIKVSSFRYYCSGEKFCPTSIEAQDYFSGIARFATLTAGVSDQEKNMPLEFFPNPTNDFLKINSSAKKGIVFDNLGRIVMTNVWSDEENSKTLNVSELAPGCYTLLLEDGMLRSTGKFIK